MQIPIVLWYFSESTCIRALNWNELLLTCSRNENIKCDSCTSWKAKSISSQLHNARRACKIPSAAAGLIHRVRQAENCKLASLCVGCPLSLSAASVSRVDGGILFALALCGRCDYVADSRIVCVCSRVCASGAIKLAPIFGEMQVAKSLPPAAAATWLSQLTHSLSQLERLYLTCAEIAAWKVYKCLSQIFIRFFLVLSSLAICVWRWWGFLVISRAQPAEKYTHFYACKCAIYYLCIPTHTLLSILFRCNAVWIYSAAAALYGVLMYFTCFWAPTVRKAACSYI